MTENGAAVDTATVCSAVSAAPPPTTSRTAAATPSRIAQKTRVDLGVSTAPPHASMSMTSEPESDEVTKKNTTTMIAMTLRIDPSGSVPKNSNSDVVLSTPSLTSISPSAVAFIDASPKIVNHTRLAAVGASRTPRTNSRIVRPREMRAMNMPTNGAQLVHQPQ